MLRVVLRYVAKAAQDGLPLFEKVNPDHLRTRAAINAAWEIANAGPRTKRITLMDAHRAAKEAPTEVSRLAAQAAGDAASAAYLHPIAKAHQVGHILRAAAANAVRTAELEAHYPTAANAVLEQSRE